MDKEIIKRIAYRIWQEKERLGIESTPEENWHEAEEELKKVEEEASEVGE